MAAQRKRKEDITKALRPFFAAEITRLREKKGFTKEKLAKEAVMDPGTLSRLENGTAPMREDYIEGICRSLKTDVGDFLRTVLAAYESAQKAKRPALPPDDPIRALVEKIRDRHEARARSEREFLDACLELLQVVSLRLKGK